MTTEGKYGLTVSGQRRHRPVKGDRPGPALKYAGCLTTLNICMSESRKSALSKMAHDNRCSMADIINRALDAHIQQQ